MIKIKISGDSFCSNFIRQTPNGNSIWGDFIFIFNEDIEECDYWIVYEGITSVEKTKCYVQNTIFFSAEPPSIKNYSKSFLNQFNTIFSCHNNLNHSNVIHTHPSLPWFVGLNFDFKTKTWDKLNKKKYDDFVNDSIEVKSKLISIITSNKTFTPGHKSRINFLNQIKNEFSEQIDIFGSGFSNVQDKFDGLAKYKYSLVIENSSFPNYWTEKLADCFLTETYPIYYGCPNIHDYFPEGSMSIIDIENIEESISIIKNLIASNQYENSLDSIRKSKDLILNYYNFFPVVVNYISNIENNTFIIRDKNIIKIYPENFYLKKIKGILKISFKFLDGLLRTKLMKYL